LPAEFHGAPAGAFNIGAMYRHIRSVLFLLEAEASHHAALLALRALGALPGTIRPLSGGRRTVMGLQFANPVGLAAGLDKDAVAVEGLARLGFGFIEVGTVTPRPQPGNPRPRLFRIPSQQALINRMGFNNAGALEMAQRLAALRARGRLEQTRLGVNIGKNRDTPLERASDDYRLAMQAVYEFADYLTLNLSSPNTPGLRTLQSGAALHEVLDAVSEERQTLAQRHGLRVPLVLKVAPDLVGADLELIAAAVRTYGIDGLIATNTTIERPDVAGCPHGQEAGGLSGAPLAPLALRTVARLKAFTGGDVPIIGVGGITSAEAGRALLNEGASLLQIYTGFIYRGPVLVRELVEMCRAAGMAP
jgi:dihydroorotate dehydrogenase